MKNAFRTFPPAVPALCDWLVVPKVWLLAFGCFYLFVFGFAIHTPTPIFTQNPTCHLWAINQEEKLSVPSQTDLELPDLGAALFVLSSAVCHSQQTSKEEEERFCPVHADEWQWQWLHLFVLPKRKRWMNQSACLFFLIIRKEKKTRTLRQS